MRCSRTASANMKQAVQPRAAARAALRGQLHFPDQDVPRRCARPPADDRSARTGREVIVAGSEPPTPRKPTWRPGRCRSRRRGHRGAGGLLQRLDGSPSIGRPRALQGIAGVTAAARSGTPTGASRVPSRRHAGAPAPAWDLIDVDSYRTIWRLAHGRFSLDWPPPAAAPSAAPGARSRSGATTTCSAPRPKSRRR